MQDSLGCSKKEKKKKAARAWEKCHGVCMPLILVFILGVYLQLL